MSTSHPSPEKHRGTTTRPNHTKDDALDERDYQLLLEGAQSMRDYYGEQARFAILVCGRLGLRAGELAHMTEDWIDWRRNMIEIPRFEPCTKGRNGGICGYCRQQALQRLEHDEDGNLTEEQVLADQWTPKTSAAVREIPWDFDPRTSLAIERFFDKYDQWPASRQAINRRITRAAEEAPTLDASSIYPHALRATAATYHAARGLDVLPLQSLMGWADLSTAQRYIKRSGENTARALHMTHSR